MRRETILAKLKAPLIAATALLLLGASRDSGSVQGFLVRSTYLKQGTKGLQRAADYRLKTYTDIRPTKFFGLPVWLHERVHEPLRCVERRIRATCTDDYKPKALSGWRPYNTFKAATIQGLQEYSNHVFGIAIDVDPDLNPCCGCVGKWAKVDRCKVVANEGETPIGDHEIPVCWIKAFRAYGFYWLGDDPDLRDTMHFEFLAKPGSVTCPR